MGCPKSILPFQPLSHSDILGILVVLIDLSLLISNGQWDARWHLFTHSQADCYHNQKSDFITTSAHISNTPITPDLHNTIILCSVFLSNSLCMKTRFVQDLCFFGFGFVHCLTELIRLASTVTAISCKFPGCEPDMNIQYCPDDQWS